MTPSRIKRLRGRIGATQHQFSKMVHATPSTVSRWENGASEPDAWQQSVILTMWNHVYEEPARADVAADWLGRGAALRALAVLLEPLSARSRALYSEDK